VHCWSDESGDGGGSSPKVLGTVVEVGTALPMAGAAFVEAGAVSMSSKKVLTWSWQTRAWGD
jgi:hypothetical protein